MRKKIIRLEQLQPAKEIFTDRLPLAQFREIWNDRSITYTDEQLIRIREWLYVMAEVIMGTINDNPHLLTDINNKTHEKEEENFSVQTGRNKKAA